MTLPRSQAVERRNGRRGAAAVELALLLPVLIFTSMAAVDFARVAYVQLTLQNCARNGALYEFYKEGGFALPSGWTSLSAAVQADQGSLSVTATATSPASSTNNYVTVTATTTFAPIALPAMHGLPSIPGTVTLAQSATMPYPPSANTVQ